ncbi:MAG: helix-turn-helix transcriptional regulator [Actinobacteria bacterium]|nr:helix-turn-helix transcriptional regulator [Actinomycetota bacterium]
MLQCAVDIEPFMEPSGSGSAFDRRKNGPDDVDAGARADDFPPNLCLLSAPRASQPACLLPSLPDRYSGELEGRRVEIPRGRYEPQFGSNLKRLLGLHDLTRAQAAKHFGVSPQAVSEWISETRPGGRRAPNVETLVRVSDFFEVSGDGLLVAPFQDLLASDLCDRERFLRVEEKIRGEAASVVPLRGVDKSGRAEND